MIAPSDTGQQYDLNCRIPVTARIPVNASREKVWEAISASGNLQIAHPFVRSNPVDHWPGPDARDHILYHSGLRMTRQFIAWYDGSTADTSGNATDRLVGYDLNIWHQPDAVSHVRWRVTRSKSGYSELAITVWPYLLSKWPPVLRQLGQIFGVRPMMRWYLRSVVRGFRHVIETGQPVRRNQFGWHPVFSPRAG